jgi:hypothetical protein
MIVMEREEVAAVMEIPDEVQRWTAKRQAALVLSIIIGSRRAGRQAIRAQTVVQKS